MIRVITALFILSICIIIYLADAGKADSILNFVRKIPGRDVTGHFVLIGILTLLVNLSLNGKYFTLLRSKVFTGSASVAIIMTLEEISQIFLTERTFSYVDLVADYAGIIVFSWVSTYFIKKQNVKRL